MNTNRTLKIFFSLNLFFIASYNYGMQQQITHSYENPSGELLWKEIGKTKEALEEISQLDHLSKPYKQLHKKIDDTLKNNLEELINNGANPNTKLISHNVPENQLLEKELYPLSQTVAMDFIDSTALLIKKKGDVNYSYPTTGNLLYWANSADMVTLLIQAGVDIESGDGQSPNFFSNFVWLKSTLEEVQRIYETFVPPIKNTDEWGKEIALSPTTIGIFHSLAYVAITLDRFPQQVPGITEESLYQKAAYLMSLGVHNSYPDALSNVTPQEIINTTNLDQLKALFNDPEVQKAAIKEIKKNQEHIVIQLQKREYGLLKGNKVKLH